MKRRSTRLVVLAVSLLLPAVAQAGPIFFPGKLADGKFVRDKDTPADFYRIQYSTVTATVEGEAAEVKVQETIIGPEKVVATVCLIPLPEGAVGSEAQVSVGIATGERGQLPIEISGPSAATGVGVRTKFLAPAEAQKVYEAISKGSDSVKVLALSGRPALLVPEFRLLGKVEVTVMYRQKVNTRGLCRLECPMPVTQFARGPVARLTAAITLVSGEPIRAIFSPTHEVTVERSAPHRAVARVRSDNWSGTDDLRLVWVADRDDLGLRVLACRPDADEDGYFMLVGNPTGGAAERAADKDVIFVLDTSGSMRGEKIEQARAAIDYCLQQLNPGDRFNVITFGTEVAEFRPAPVARSQSTLAAAREFVDSVVAKGETNISGALARALSGERANRPKIVIFLTDGTPTAGELVPEAIVKTAKDANTSGARIFAMGLGHDVNAHLLDKLAEVTDGSSEYVTPGEEIDAKVAALYDRLAHPVLTNVEVAFGDLQKHSVYPEKLPALFRGSEIMVFGRYRGGGKHTFTVSGQQAGRTVKYTCVADLPEKPPSPRPSPEGRGDASATAGENDFVASLWAARKIGYLLQELRLHGKNDELIAEVVKLSKRFGVVTEYTAFLATAKGDMTAAAAVGEAGRLMLTANGQQAGQWAVNQAFNDRQLQNRMVASQAGNTYRDRRGNVVANDNIRQVGRRVFYLRDGQWIDGEDAGKRKARVVKLHDKEYQDLVRNNRDFAQAQQLGWAVEMNVGSERIIVEKDGKQKDEELRKQAVQPPAEDLQPIPMNQMQQQFRNQVPLQQNQLQQVPRRGPEQKRNIENQR